MASTSAWLARSSGATASTKRIGILAKNGGNKDASELDAAFEFFEFRAPRPTASGRSLWQGLRGPNRRTSGVNRDDRRPAQGGPGGRFRWSAASRRSSASCPPARTPRAPAAGQEKWQAERVDERLIHAAQLDQLPIDGLAFSEFHPCRA